MRSIPLSSLSYVVFDFETTGLNANDGDEIIEIGAVRVDGKKVSERTFHSLVNPERSLSEESTRVHGITAAELKGAPSIQAIMPDFLRYLGRNIVVAQNARFDLSFLVKNLVRLSIARFENPILDTMLL